MERSCFIYLPLKGTLHEPAVGMTRGGGGHHHPPASHRPLSHTEPGLSTGPWHVLTVWSIQGLHSQNSTQLLSLSFNKIYLHLDQAGKMSRKNVFISSDKIGLLSFHTTIHQANR